MVNAVTPVATPRVSSTSPTARNSPIATSAPHPILTTGSVPSEVSHLFRTKRVSDIRQFEARIRNEAEEKSESLRQLLGTRYRDLLRAADQITNMSDASTVSIRNALQTVSKTSAQLCDDLNARARPLSTEASSNTASTSPATPSSSNSDADLVRRRAVHAVGSRLKHIVDSPEVLYACLEEGELYEAASRFVIAERNYRDLVESPTDEEAVASRFAHARWRLVSAFRPKILAAAERRLVVSGLDARSYAGVLAAIVLLSERCDVVAAAEVMLAVRTTWLVDASKRSDTSAGDTIRAIASVVRDTVSCMARLFWRDTDHGVEALVRAVDVPSADVVRAARDRGGLNGTVVAWTANVRAWLHEHGDALLAAAVSSRQVADALRAVDDVFSDSDWSLDCDAALQQSTEFVFDIFKPFISQRAAVVAEESVQNAVRKVLADVNSAWDDIDGSSDVGKVIWSAIASQAVSLGARVREPDIRGHRLRSIEEEGEVARMLWHNGPVAGVIQTFESSLSEALDDVKSLALRVPSVSAAFDTAVCTNIPQILDHLQKRVESINNKSQADPQTPSLDLGDARMEHCLFVARVATALGAADCVRLAYNFSFDNTDGRQLRNGALSDLRKHADQVSRTGYRIWARLLCEGLAADLLRELTLGKPLVVETGWSNSADVNIPDRTISSQDDLNAVRFPTTASTGAVNTLIRVCKAANHAGGFALPIEAVEYVCDALTHVVAHVYRSALVDYIDGVDTEREVDEGGHVKDKCDNVDKAVMQMLFDVQTMQLLLGKDSFDSLRSNSGEKETLKKLEGEIQAHIDPIDLASCRKAMRESVNSYVARTSTLFGPLARRCDGRAVWTGSVRGISNVSASSNLVRLSRPVTRFTYLPAPMPSTYTNAGVSTAGLNAKAAVGALRNETASVNSVMNRKRDSIDTSVAGYASKVSESVGRLGRGFFESLTRKVA